MLKFRSAPFDEEIGKEIEKATNENNLTEDWSLIMHICDKVTNYQDGAKFCLKAIVKRLHHNVPRVVIQTLILLDACVKNCDRYFLLQVASSDFTTEVRKLLQKMHPSAAAKLKELLQKWAHEEFKDDPELCIIPSLYYKLKSEGVDFEPLVKETKAKAPICTNPDVVSSQEEENDIIKAIEISLRDTGRYVPDDLGNRVGSELSLTTSTIEPFKVRALYDFEAAEDNELTIKLGEIVLVLDNSNSSWWRGSNHRGEGLFPANFVTEDLEAPVVSNEAQVTQAVVQESLVEELSQNKEVKLDEDKIEMTINWLNEADPTSEIPDPNEMLLLERECCLMVPLLEEKLQDADSQIALLGQVNKQIMEAFDLFYSLSINVRDFSAPNMALYSQNQVLSTATATTTQPNMPPTSYTATIGGQYILSRDPMQGGPVHPAHMQQPQLAATTIPQQSQLAATTIVQQSQLPSTTIPHQSISQTDVSTSPDKVPHPNSSSMAIEHHASAVESGVQPVIQPAAQFVGHPAMFPQQPYGAYLQNPGLIHGPIFLPNIMPYPHPMTSIGPYVQLPYYLNRNARFPVYNKATVTSSKLNTGHTQSPSLNINTAVRAEATPAFSNQTHLNYSTDLQQLHLNAKNSPPKELPPVCFDSRAAIHTSLTTFIQNPMTSSTEQL